MKTCIVFAFDMETDIGSYLKTYNGVRSGTDRILSVLQKYDVPATFLFTGDTALNNRDVVQKIAGLGFEIGCHSLAHETVGEAHFNMPGDLAVLDTEVENLLRLNKQIVQEASGIEPRVFRAPRLWQGHAQIEALEKLGFTVDASYSVAAHAKHILPYSPLPGELARGGGHVAPRSAQFRLSRRPQRLHQVFLQERPVAPPAPPGRGVRFREPEGRHREAEEALRSIDAPVLPAPVGIRAHVRRPGSTTKACSISRPELVQNCGEAMGKNFERYVQLCRDEGFEFATCGGFARTWEENRNG